VSDEQSNGKTDEQKARELILAARKQREQDCQEAIRIACEQYRCRLSVYEVRKDGKTIRMDVQAEAIE